MKNGKKKEGKKGLRKEMSSLSLSLDIFLLPYDFKTRRRGGQTSCIKCKDEFHGKAMMNRSISRGRK